MERPAEVEVRVGEVVEPEGPEDWRRPLTWLAAAGMLAAPIAALGWLGLVPPEQPRLAAGAWLVAGLLPAGSALTASTQRGPLRAVAAALGAGLFAALLTLVLASSLAGEPARQGAPSLLAHVVPALAAGGIGVLLAAAASGATADRRARLARAGVPGAVGAGLALLLLPAIAGAVLAGPGG